MTEQVVDGVVSAEVDQDNQMIIEKGTLGAETSGASSKKLYTSWNLKGATGKVRLIVQGPKTLTQRFNEAYDEDARREDEEFFRTTKAYYRRRFNAED